MYIDDIENKKRINEIENGRRELIKKFEIIESKIKYNKIKKG